MAETVKSESTETKAPVTAAARRWHDAYQSVLSQLDLIKGDEVTQALEKIVGKPPRPADGESYRLYMLLLEDLLRLSTYDEKYPRAVTVFGGARLKESEPYYALANELGQRLAEKGFPVRTGAGPGIMDAVPAGYKSAVLATPSLRGSTTISEHSTELFRTQGIRIELPFEQAISSNIDVNTMLKTFSLRRAALIWKCRALAVLPGGLGTVNEMFEAWLGKKEGNVRCPIVAFPSRFYDPFLKAILGVAVEKRGLISQSDFDLIGCARNVDEATGMLCRDWVPDAEKEETDQLTFRERLLSLRHELGRGLKQVSELPPAVTFIGAGESVGSDDAEIQFCTALAKVLCKGNSGVDFRVGSIGVLETAIAESVNATDGSMGSGAISKICAMQRFVMQESLGDEVLVADPYTSGLIAGKFKSRIALRQVLLENCQALVFTPCDLVGFDVLFSAICEMQTRRRQVRPILLLGRDFWEPIVGGLREMLKGDYEGQFISDRDLDLLQVVDISREGSLSEVVKVIQSQL